LDFLKQKPKSFFSPQEQEKIVNAIREAEKNTSGEVRVFVESKCRFVNALDRAAEIFNALKMQQTAQRNATLVYVAMKDKQLAVLGDEGIYKKQGNFFGIMQCTQCFCNLISKTLQTALRMWYSKLGRL